MAERDLPFARDLGYLDKFLASLGAHADGLAEPQRSELKRLVAAEVSQWGRIKALLRGEAPASEAKEASGQATTAADPAPVPPRGLTVGSLMPRP